MPHLHLSLQHGDDMILKRMKRRHSRARSVEFCQTVRRLRPDISLGADLIAGFPTETRDMFANTLSIVDECGLDHLHVFPFSPRPGTPAARMPQLDRALVKERAGRLREKGRAAFARHLDAMVGRTAHVLVERPGFGRAGQYTPVALPDRMGEGVVQARLTGHDGAMLTGMPAADALRGAA